RGDSQRQRDRGADHHAAGLRTFRAGDVSSRASAGGTAGGGAGGTGHQCGSNGDSGGGQGVGEDGESGEAAAAVRGGGKARLVDAPSQPLERPFSPTAA